MRLQKLIIASSAVTLPGLSIAACINLSNSACCSAVKGKGPTLGGKSNNNSPQGLDR